MDVIVLLLMLAFVVMGWRLICRVWIGRGGKRWVGHALGFIFGPLIGVMASIPMLPSKEDPATIGNLIVGLVIAAGFLFLEYRAKNSALLPANSKRSKRAQKSAAARSNNNAAAIPAVEPSRELSFSLKDTAELILADDVVDQREAELLLNLLDKQDIIKFDPTCRALHQVLIASLEDGVLDSDEAEEIKALLSEICDRPIARKQQATAKKKKPKTRPASFYAKKQRAQKSSNARALQAGDMIAFMYVDSKGDSSDREVRFRSTTRKDGVVYVKGICQTRKAFRTFREDRMELPCFVDTGEVVNV